jgi:formylglycine-generating enzyme required for sulfatase activity
MKHSVVWAHVTLGVFTVLPVWSQEEITIELSGGETMEMVWVEPGTFIMGLTEEQEELLLDRNDWIKDERPAHEVSISRGFYLGKHEITQEQWHTTMGTTPWSEGIHVQVGPAHPAAYISWYDVQEFIAAMNEAVDEELYRLPTEAEWEYACRAGTTTLWSSGDGEDQLGEYAWYAPNAFNAGLTYAQPVGTKLPNSWGLYDMHGNLFEWVQDWFGANHYQQSVGVDPPGPATGLVCVVRGGCFSADGENLRSARRESFHPGDRSYGIGARILRVGPKIGDTQTSVARRSWGQLKNNAR